MSQETYKHILKLFSLIVVVVGVYQTYRFQTTELQARLLENNSTSSASNTTAVDANASYESGVTILSTTQAEAFVRQSLTRRGLTPVIKPYALTGIQWVFNIALTYGHIVVALYIYSVFKNPQNPASKKTLIVGVGIVILIGWIYMSSRIGYQKIKVIDQNGRVLYHSERAEEKDKFEVFLNENDNANLFIVHPKEGGSGQVPSAKVQEDKPSGQIPQDNEPIERVSDEIQEIRLPEIDTGL